MFVVCELINVNDQLCLLCPNVRQLISGKDQLCCVGMRQLINAKDQLCCVGIY